MYFSLEDDKNLLKREYSRMPKPAELERRIEQLKAQNDEISREITVRQEEIKELNQTILDKTGQIETRKRELKEALDAVENFKNDYVQVNSLPMQISKECDRLLFESELVNNQKTNPLKHMSVEKKPYFMYILKKGAY